MRKLAVVIAAFFVLSPFALASQPGQPMDCSDFVPVTPGFTCENFCAPPCPDAVASAWSPGSPTLTNEGEIIQIRKVGSEVICGPFPLWRYEVVALTATTERLIGYWQERCLVDNDPAWQKDTLQFSPAVVFDDKRGRVLVKAVARCVAAGTSPCSPEYDYDDPPWIGGIIGFQTTFDLMQTYSPPTAFSFQVPYMPEGLGAADRFDTYWGRSLARSICRRPSRCIAPTRTISRRVGERVTFADTAPTPAPGRRDLLPHQRYLPGPDPRRAAGARRSPARQRCQPASSMR